MSERTKVRSEKEYKSLIHRLNRIEGQIRGLRGMLEDDAYCMDILVQSSAASAALTAFNRELLSTHIESCVVDGIRQGDGRYRRGKGRKRGRAYGASP